uniref:Reverse transcriptase domain-containing protein n=1 Tax=Tanacetum cinerariifolium TaxID=118510 RepID=A0A6L2MML9_TANCI|nr:hypothetical protein [Tanacetum cinerariifolium]
MLQVLVVDQTSVTFVHHMRLAAPYLLRGLATPYLLRRLVAPYLLRGLATPYLLRRLVAPYLLRGLATPYLLMGHYSLVIASGPKGVGARLKIHLEGFWVSFGGSTGGVLDLVRLKGIWISIGGLFRSRSEACLKGVRSELFGFHSEVFESRSEVVEPHPKVVESRPEVVESRPEVVESHPELIVELDTKLETLIATYDIPLDLRPCLLDPNFRMINLPAGDTAIGIYSRIFDSSGVRIPFSSFLLAVLKYFKVHISQLVPLAMSIYDFLCMPSLDKVTVREEPHGLDTSILGRVADRTTSPALAVTKADHATKRKASTRPEISTNASKKTRSSKKGSGAGSNRQAARDEVEQADDRTFDDDDQRDISEIALEGIKSLNDVSQGPAFARLMAAPAPDAQPLDADVGADEIASDDNVDPYYEARVGNTVGDVLERDLLLIVLGPYYISYPYDEVVVVDGGDGGLKGCLVPWFLKPRSPKIPTLSGEIRLEKVNHYDHDGVGENANHKNFGLDNLQIGCSLLQDIHTSACHRLGRTMIELGVGATVLALSQIATMEPLDSFLMGDEVISNISAREIDEFVKSSVDDPVPILKESEVTSDSTLECDMHVTAPLPPTDSGPPELTPVIDEPILLVILPLPCTDVLGDVIVDIDLLLGEHLDTLSTGDREIDFNPSRDIEELKRLLVDDPVLIPRVFDEPLGNSDSTSRSSETSGLFEELIAEFGLDDSIPTESDDRVLLTRSTLPDPKQICSREVEIFDPFFYQTQSEIPSNKSKVHIEVLSVLWGNRLSILDGSLPLSRKHRNERDTLAIEKEKIEEELVETKSQLEHHKRFLKSGEFNRAFTGVLNTSINVLVEQGLRMDRFDEEFSDLFQRVIGFIPDAKEKFNRVVAAFSDTTFSFLDKVSQSSQSSLQDISWLEPDNVTPSHQTSSATSSLRPNTDVRHFTSSSRTFGHTSTPDH